MRRKVLRAWSHLQTLASPHQEADRFLSYEHREILRRGRLLASVLLLSYPLNFLLLLTSLFPYRDWISFVIIISVILTQTVCLAVNRRGRVPFAVTLYLMTLVGGTAAAMFTPHFGSSLFGMFTYPFLCIPVVASAYMSGSHAPMPYWMMSCWLIGGHIALHAKELQTCEQTKNISLIGLWAISTSTLSVLTLVSCMGAKSMENALRSADRADELEAMNGELSAMQQELEAQYSQLEEANVRLEQLAATDGLTGLANHRAFQEELAHLVARVKRDGKPLSVLLLDVDYFKKYNDSFGHPAGDEVLKTIAQILKQTIRQSDLAARYGGEEFAILLYDADAETAAIVAERSRAAIAAHEFPHREVTVSVGVAVHVVGEEGAVLVQRTDTALYQSKHNGRNRVTVSEVLPFAHAA